MKTFRLIWLLALLLAYPLAACAVDQPTKFLNQDGVINTRHNLTQSPIGPGSVTMDNYRNDYGEVCVYCHTPHGANTTTTAPLWNRTMKSNTYTSYSSMTIEGVVGSPGANSLTCLSCHDGTTAIDSIINMPGSGKYLKAQEITQSNTFLNDQWTNNTLDATVHLTMDATDLVPQTSTSCLVCHSTANGALAATDFSAFALGTDLSNDHPIGVPYRGLTAGTEYNATTGTSGNLKFFDKDGDNRADKDEVRLYNTGDGFEVECATCHDPHGVPSGGAGSQFIKTFLRATNAGSALCLTCHTK